MCFLSAWGVNDEDVIQIQQPIRTQLLRHARAHGFLDPDDAQHMLTWADGGGISLDPNVLTSAHDSEGLERLIRDVPRPIVAHERLLNGEGPPSWLACSCASP